jgi:AcrR family transcriptional regulator
MRDAKTSARGPGRPPAQSGVHGREALVEATLELLGEPGKPFTLRAVAERAGVQPTLVHYHFGSREELIRAALDGLTGRVIGELEAATAGDEGVEARLRALVRQAVQTFHRHPYLPRLVIEQVLLPDDAQPDAVADRAAQRCARMFAEVLGAGRASGELNEIDPRHAVPMILGTCAWFFLAGRLTRREFGLDPDDAETVEDFGRHAADFVWNALREARP